MASLFIEEVNETEKNARIFRRFEILQYFLPFENRAFPCSFWIIKSLF
jgi:hypothetical protein